MGLKPIQDKNMCIGRFCKWVKKVLGWFRVYISQMIVNGQPHASECMGSMVHIKYLIKSIKVPKCYCIGQNILFTKFKHKKCKKLLFLPKDLLKD
jgi:hypothetical protein